MMYRCKDCFALNWRWQCIETDSANIRPLAGGWKLPETTLFQRSATQLTFNRTEYPGSRLMADNLHLDEGLQPEPRSLDDPFVNTGRSNLCRATIEDFWPWTYFEIASNLTSNPALHLCQVNRQVVHERSVARHSQSTYKEKNDQPPRSQPLAL